MLTEGSSSSGTTSGDIRASSTFVKARVEIIEKRIGGRQPRYKPKPEDVLPEDPKWEKIGDRVIRRCNGINQPEGVWPEVWQETA